MNIRKKGVQHEDFPGGHPSEYYPRPSTFHFGFLMGSGALVLVRSRPLTHYNNLFLSELPRNRNFKRSKDQKFAIETPISPLIVPNDSFPLTVIFTFTKDNVHSNCPLISQQKK